jgi:hypothetical protein
MAEHTRFSTLTQLGPLDFGTWCKLIDRWPPVVGEVGVGPRFPARCLPPFAPGTLYVSLQRDGERKLSRWWQVFLRKSGAMHQGLIRHNVRTLAKALGMSPHNLVEAALYALICPGDWLYLGRDWFEGSDSPNYVRVRRAPDNLDDGARALLRERFGDTWWAVAQALPLDRGLIQYLASRTKTAPAETAASKHTKGLGLLYGPAVELLDELQAILDDPKLTVDEKLKELSDRAPISDDLTAEQIAEALRVHKGSVIRTQWWKDRRDRLTESRWHAREARRGSLG